MRSPGQVRKLLAPLLVVVALVLGSRAAAGQGRVSNAPITRESLIAALSGYESEPSAQQWAVLGAPAAALLPVIARDATQPPVIRIRALHGLAYFPTLSSESVLASVARSDPYDLIVRHALLSLRAGFPTRAERYARELIGHREVVVRETAAKMLLEIGTTSALRTLRGRQSAETDPVIVEILMLASPAGTSRTTR